MIQYEPNFQKMGRSLHLSVITLFIVIFALALVPVTAQETDMEKPNIVLVHGAWADGSSWTPTIKLLQEAGYNVLAPQLPHTSLQDNVNKLNRVMDTLEGPIVLAGHSYGGQVITAAATGNENVIALVYIAAFGLDEGESIGALLEASAPGPALHHLIFDEAGYAWLPEEDFVTYFASDVAPEEARVMYATQQPLVGTALTDVMGEPAWKTIPSWYLVATNDEAIPPDAERLFAARMGATTVEVESSHVAMYSHPQETADLIMAAAGQ